MIYKEVLVSKNPLVLAEVSDGGFSHHGCLGKAIMDSEHGALRTPNLLPSDMFYLLNGQHICATSSQIYKEAMPIYFQCNSFRFHNFHNLSAFLRWIGKEPCKHIRKVVFDYFGGQAPSAFGFLAKCDRLEHLVIKMTAQSLVGAPKANRVPVKAIGLRHLLKIRGIQTLEIEWLGSEEVFSTEMQDEFLEALQVLHQPRRTPRARR